MLLFLARLLPLALISYALSSSGKPPVFRLTHEVARNGEEHCWTGEEEIAWWIPLVDDLLIGRSQLSH